MKALMVKLAKKPIGYLGREIDSKDVRFLNGTWYWRGRVVDPESIGYYDGQFYIMPDGMPNK